MTYGSALSSSQLAATANVSGSFVYSPPAGSVPAAGLDTLSVTFYPADTTDYSPTSASVVVNVVAPESASGAPSFVVTKMLSRDNSNNIVATLSIANTGSQAAGATGYPMVSITAAKLGAQQPETSLPVVVGSIGPGSSAQAKIVFPAITGTAGASVQLAIGGSWYVFVCCQLGQPTENGGSFGSTSRATLP